MPNRYDESRRGGYKDRAVKLPYEARENDRLAELTEWFVLTPFGLTDLIRQRGAKTCDWRVVHQGKRTVVSCGDVKWTPLEDGGLILPTYKTHVCTAYVLVVGPEGHFRLAGWEWGHILSKAPLDTSGRFPEPPHHIPQSDLRSPESLPILMAATYGAVRR